MAARTWHDDKVLRRLHTHGERVFDIGRIAQVDVVIDHDHHIEVLQRAKGRHDGVALKAVMLRRRFLHLHDRVEAMQSARRHFRIDHDRHGRLQRP